MWSSPTDTWLDSVLPEDAGQMWLQETLSTQVTLYVTKRTQFSGSTTVPDLELPL